MTETFLETLESWDCEAGSVVVEYVSVGTGPFSIGRKTEYLIATLAVGESIANMDSLSKLIKTEFHEAHYLEIRSTRENMFVQYMFHRELFEYERIKKLFSFTTYGGWPGTGKGITQGQLDSVA